MVNEIYFALIALLIIAGISLGILISLAIFILGKQDGTAQTSSASKAPVDRNKRIANLTVKMGAGLTAIVFSANLVSIEQDNILAAILLVIGLGVVVFSWIQFHKM